MHHVCIVFFEYFQWFFVFVVCGCLRRYGAHSVVRVCVRMYVHTRGRGYMNLSFRVSTLFCVAISKLVCVFYVCAFYTCTTCKHAPCLCFWNHSLHFKIFLCVLTRYEWFMVWMLTPCLCFSNSSLHFKIFLCVLTRYEWFIFLNISNPSLHFKIFLCVLTRYEWFIFWMLTPCLCISNPSLHFKIFFLKPNILNN